MVASMTALISAGSVSEDDNKWLMIQGLSQENAQAVADWLAIATNGPVLLRFTSLMDGIFDERIRSAPETIAWSEMGSKSKDSSA